VGKEAAAHLHLPPTQSPSRQLRGRGKGRREEERGGRRRTWNPAHVTAPARVWPVQDPPTRARLRPVRDSSPVCDRLPLCPPQPASSPVTDSGPVPNRNFALRPRDWQLRPPLLFPLLLCGSPLAPLLPLLFLPLLPLLFLRLVPMLCSFLCSTLLSLLCSFLLFMCYSLIVGMDSSQVCSFDVVA